MINELIQSNHLQYLFAPSPGANAYLDAFLLNLIFTTPLVFVILYLFPKRFKKPELYFLLLALAFCAFIPVFGVVLLLLLAISLNFYAKKYSYVNIASAIQKQYGSEKIATVVPYGAGWAYTRIFDSKFNKKDRERALYAINRQRSKQVNDINRALLSDNVDEIRLYAFNALNRQQSQITHAIKQYLEVKNHAKNELELAEINKSLALLYWEYHSINLNPGQISDSMLHKALLYVNEAIPVLSTDSSLWLLLAKIYHAQGEIDQYRQALETASHMPNAPAEVYLNLAALSFEEKNYEQVRNYLLHGVNNHIISGNASLIQFWCDSI